MSGRIPIAGNIIVEDYLDITSDSNFSVSDTSHVEFPTDLCTRHPLFGKGELLYNYFFSVSQR